MEASRFVILGHIGGVYGVRGWVRICSYTEPPGRLLDYSPWWLRDADRWQQILVRDRHRGAEHGLRVALAGITDRDQAQRLIGLELGVPRAQLPPPLPGEFYWCDLLGLEVINRDAQVLGRVKRILQTEAHGVLQIDGDREYLIPLLLDHYVQEVDLAAGTIRVDWQEPA